ncbi:DUF7946 domain-containing protein [Aliiroseovarius crassostreae]|uniref:DUF7946 domain-containing protein n=1 Tax=Aliiroseovarius crassostreae TaxID=154981 RepID=UPI0022043233|nr:hypothetical protein [Aliiroseovarius crassostreae]UWQ08850.1 hypothetical protein K3X25_04520 [Aliiroseovarius crassostreae]
MVVLAEHKIKVRYLGGSAENNVLPLYDGTTSIQGVGQALQIATHAYLTGEVVSRATAMKGARMFLRPTRPGSYLFEIITLLEAYPATSSAAVAVSAPVFYDFIKTAFSRATGSLDAEPTAKHLKKVFERKDPPPLEKPADLDDLAERLEGSLQRAHRPISELDGVDKIQIETPRTKLITFDTASKDWVFTQEEDDGLQVLEGNVTRFNALSRNGRAFLDQLERVVPFRPSQDFPTEKLPMLTWSLHGRTAQLRNKLTFKVRKVRSAHGETKRIILVDCDMVPEK